MAMSYARSAFTFPGHQVSLEEPQDGFGTGMLGVLGELLGRSPPFFAPGLRTAALPLLGELEHRVLERSVLLGNHYPASSFSSPSRPWLRPRPPLSRDQPDDPPAVG